jgi:nucleotidyltransferase substrate binding protein (TIGR01987 family)
LKVYLESEAILVNSPKRALQEAYKIGIIKEEDTALTMLDDRNLTSHTYDESGVKGVRDGIAIQYLKLFKNALERMTR